MLFRSVGVVRLLRRRLRAAPLRVLSAIGRMTGLARRADRAIAAASAGCLFEHVPEVRPCEAAIVLGAYVFPDGTPSDMLADRLVAGLALWRAGAVQRVIVSGGADEAAGMAAWLSRHGVGDAAIVVDAGGVRTRATMVRAASSGVRTAVVCTQRFHLPRALFLAQAAGIAAVGLVADARSYGSEAANARREAIARVRAWLDELFHELHPRATLEELESDIKQQRDRLESYRERETTAERDLAEVTGQPEFVAPPSFVVVIPAPAITMIADWFDRAIASDRVPVTPRIVTDVVVAVSPTGEQVRESIEYVGPARLFTIRTTIHTDDSTGTSWACLDIVKDDLKWNI